jgi:hypothetical protein
MLMIFAAHFILEVLLLQYLTQSFCNCYKFVKD